MTVTVFTPTYNRAYILQKLYQSLQAQTCHDFEWLIVDDGSTDETETLVRGWQTEGKLPTLRYLRQPNGGKHRAINRGVREAQGQLFFIVDSDDHLTPDAIVWILQQWQPIKNDPTYAGLSGIRIHPNGTRIGGGPNFGTIDADAISIRTRHHIAGDLAEIYRTDILRQYPFPDIPGEKFCSEGLIWGRIAHHYRLRYIHHGIYICAYLTDGLTHNSIKCRMRSPRYAQLLYSEMARDPHNPLSIKIRHFINFWVFGLSGPDSFSDLTHQISWKGLPFVFPGALINRYYHHLLRKQ